MHPKSPARYQFMLQVRDSNASKHDLYLKDTHSRDLTTSSSDLRGCIDFSSLDFKAAELSGEPPGAGTPSCESSPAQNSRAFCVCLFLGYL